MYKRIRTYSVESRLPFELLFVVCILICVILLLWPQVWPIPEKQQQASSQCEGLE